MTNEEKAKRLDEIASCPLCMQAQDAPLLRESAAMWRDIAEALKDGARLDWYEKNHRRVSFGKGCNGEKDCWVWRGESHASPFYAEDTLRAAIDAAMGGE